MSDKRIRVLLVEDHAVVREGLSALLRAEVDIEVVATAGDGLEALARAAELRPDVVVTDIGLPGLNGVELIRRIRTEVPGTAVLALSMHDDAAIVERSVAAGVSGYILKGADVKELCRGIRAVANGETYFSDHLPIGRDLRRGVALLTDREREILQLVAEGFTAKEIAERLGLSPRTVENHRANIMDRLGIRTTAGLVRYALRNGIIL